MADKERITPKSVGPGSVEQQDIQPDPILQGATEFEWVEILNPMSVDFIGQYGVTRPVNAPVKVIQSEGMSTVTKNEGDVARNYGVDLRNPDHPGKADAIVPVEIKSGKTKKMRANDAIPILKQLVDQVMQSEDATAKLADPVSRNKVEKRIVIGRGSMNDLMGEVPTVEQQFTKALEEKNDEPFGEENPSETPVASEPGRRGPGRPPKAQPAAA